MATRGLYKFYSDTEQLENNRPNATIYRHWDNYLEGGGADLVEFLTTLRDSDFDNRFLDSSYLASKFVVYLAREFANDWNEEPLDFLSVGVVHNDDDWGAEYTYHIVSEIGVDNIPKVFVDSYNYDKTELSEAFKQEQEQEVL